MQVEGGRASGGPTSPGGWAFGVTAAGRQNPTLTWDLYLDEVLPSLLDQAGVAAVEAVAIVSDVAQRGRDYAGGGRGSRRALRAPFLDDVVDFAPTEAPIGCKADVAAVVRNSVLEDVHARGLVGDDALTQITYLATGAFNAWLIKHATEADGAPVGVFAAVADHPRAYAALQALALAAERGGRQAFRMPDGPIPELPPPGMHEAVGGKVRRSGLSTLDDQFLRNLQAVAEGEMDVLFASSLSRFSRDSGRLASVIEHVLAHRGTLLTTNFLLRPREAFSRRPPLIGANSHDPLSVITTDGLSGLHVKYVRLIRHMVEVEN